MARRVQDGMRTHQNRLDPPTAACVPWLSGTASSHTASESGARPRVTADRSVSARLLVGRSDVPDQVSLYLVARGALPGRVLRLAAEADCMFAIDTGTHAPGQLGWLGNGCTRADRFGISPSRVVNARSTDDLASVAGRWPA